MERRRSGAFSEVESERNDANEPQTEAGASGVNQETFARDERRRCGAEQAMSRRGDKVETEACGVQQRPRWSRR